MPPKDRNAEKSALGFDYQRMYAIKEALTYYNNKKIKSFLIREENKNGEDFDLIIKRKTGMQIKLYQIKYTTSKESFVINSGIMKVFKTHFDNWNTEENSIKQIYYISGNKSGDDTFDNKFTNIINLWKSKKFETVYRYLLILYLSKEIDKCIGKHATKITLNNNIVIQKIKIKSKPHFKLTIYNKIGRKKKIFNSGSETKTINKIYSTLFDCFDENGNPIFENIDNAQYLELLKNIFNKLHDDNLLKKLLMNRENTVEYIKLFKFKIGKSYNDLYNEINELIKHTKTLHQIFKRDFTKKYRDSWSTIINSLFYDYFKKNMNNGNKEINCKEIIKSIIATYNNCHDTEDFIKLLLNHIENGLDEDTPIDILNNYIKIVCDVIYNISINKHTKISAVIRRLIDIINKFKLRRERATMFLIRVIVVKGLEKFKFDMDNENNKMLLGCANYLISSKTRTRIYGKKGTTRLEKICEKIDE